MYYPPYSPNFNYEAYNMAWGVKKNLRKTSNAVCWVVVAALLLMIGIEGFLCPYYLKAVGYTADYSNPDFNGFTPILYYLTTAAGYVVGLSVPVLLYFAFKRVSLRNFLPFQKTGFFRTAACVFFGAAVCMLANIPANIVVAIEKALGFSGDMPQSPLTDDPAILILYGIVICVIPPIVEELLFRGLVLQSLRKYGNGFAIVGSAMLFGLYHGNFVQMVFAFIAGLVMALVVVRTGSLWTSIVIHFLNNSISYALEMVQRYNGDEAMNQASSVVMLVMIALGVLSLIWLMIKDKSFFRSEAPNPGLPFSAKLGALFANPGGVAMIIFALYSSIKILVSY